MTVINSRESFLAHEDPEYIKSRPDWIVGKVPDLCDYRKLSVDNMDEAMKLAALGAKLARMICPMYKGKPMATYFTQSLAIGASLIDRKTAQKLGLNYEKYRSVLCILPSRAGKSFLQAICCIAQAGANNIEVNIGAATMPKAQIIQKKIVELLPFANKKILDGLIVEANKDNDDAKYAKIERMSTQVSKESLKWKGGGSIGLFSTNESQKNTDVAAAGAIGIGGTYVCLDEIQIMSPVGFRTASRFMVENPDTKRFCVGNPMINGHFKELYEDPGTFVIHANEITLLIEQRFTRKGIELTGIPPYSDEYRYYVMTEFPNAETGTRFFSTLPTIYDEGKFGDPAQKWYFLGIDSAYKGGDGLVISLLSYNKSVEKSWFVLEEQIDLKKKHPNWTKDTTMLIALDILKMYEKYNIILGCLDIGFGIHIYEQVKNLAPDVPLEPINYASKPTEWRKDNDYNAKYASNMRAELHLDMRDVCSNELFYVAPSLYDDLIKEMREVGQSPAKEKIQIEPKKNIKQRLGKSPDNLDSACLALHACVISGILSGNEVNDDVSLMEVF